MLATRNNLSLDHITATTRFKTIRTMPVSEGLIIRAKDNAEDVPIAFIYWDNTVQNCYIQTISDRFQTYIATFESFADFIYLVDEAYRLINLTHQVSY